jgi:hypothetical protein
MSTARAILSLTPGTMIQIPGKKQPVRVTSVEVIHGTPYAFTTSGRVRPRAFAGGSLCVDKFNDGQYLWQATMQQQVVRIDSFTVLGLAN